MMCGTHSNSHPCHKNTNTQTLLHRHPHARTRTQVVSERSPVTHFIVHSRKAFLNVSQFCLVLIPNVIYLFGLFVSAIVSSVPYRVSWHDIATLGWGRARARAQGCGWAGGRVPVPVRVGGWGGCA